MEDSRWEKIVCRMAGHKWSEWERVTGCTPLGVFSFDRRKCLRCGVDQTDNYTNKKHVYQPYDGRNEVESSPTNTVMTSEEVEMKLISCDGCGLVYDQDKNIFPAESGSRDE